MLAGLAARLRDQGGAQDAHRRLKGCGDVGVAVAPVIPGGEHGGGGLAQSGAPCARAVGGVQGYRGVRRRCGSAGVRRLVGAGWVEAHCADTGVGQGQGGQHQPGRALFDQQGTVTEAVVALGLDDQAVAQQGADHLVATAGRQLAVELETVVRVPGGTGQDDGGGRGEVHRCAPGGGSRRPGACYQPEPRRAEPKRGGGGQDRHSAVSASISACRT